jgi:hypothetical protein
VNYQRLSHEIGHILGAPDQYFEGGGAYPFHWSDLMAKARTVGTTPYQGTIAQILSRNGEANYSDYTWGL